MHRMVHIDADSAVDVHGGMGDPVPCLGRPECRGGDLDVGGQIFRQPPGRLRATGAEGP